MRRWKGRRRRIQSKTRNGYFPTHTHTHTVVVVLIPSVSIWGGPLLALIFFRALPLPSNEPLFFLFHFFQSCCCCSHSSASNALCGCKASIPSLLLGGTKSGSGIEAHDVRQCFCLYSRDPWDGRSGGWAETVKIWLEGRFYCNADRGMMALTLLAPLAQRRAQPELDIGPHIAAVSLIRKLVMRKFSVTLCFALPLQQLSQLSVDLWWEMLQRGQKYSPACLPLCCGAYTHTHPFRAQQMNLLTLGKLDIHIKSFIIESPPCFFLGKAIISYAMPLHVRYTVHTHRCLQPEEEEDMRE